jgi:hypothetical protein
VRILRTAHPCYVNFRIHGGASPRAGDTPEYRKFGHVDGSHHLHRGFARDS